MVTRVTTEPEAHDVWEHEVYVPTLGQEVSTYWDVIQSYRHARSGSKLLQKAFDLLGL